VTREAAAAPAMVNDGHCFACGPNSDIGLHLHFRIVGDRAVRAETTLARPFQGWVGLAHGGIVMTLIDEGMAHAAGAAGYRGVTGEVRVRFRKAVPIGEPIAIVGRVLWQRGVVLGVEAHVEDQAGALLASGEGRFVAKGTVEPGALGLPDVV
jgi:acyl-coenzyme A thioesterase PaaI-like protein